MEQKIVIKIQMSGYRKGLFSRFILCECDEGDQGFQAKVMKTIAKTHGLSSMALKGDARDKVEVIGRGIDWTKLIQCLRKKFGHAHIESLEPIKENQHDKEKETITPIAYTSGYYPCPPPSYVYHLP